MGYQRQSAPLDELDFHINECSDESQAYNELHEAEDYKVNFAIPDELRFDGTYYLDRAPDYPKDSPISITISSKFNKIKIVKNEKQSSI